MRIQLREKQLLVRSFIVVLNLLYLNASLKVRFRSCN